MLRRITELSGIGPYANCAPGGVEFRKTALVFGYNSYGKSMLCEVLRSLETGDTAEVTVRGTIPGPMAQRATINFAEDGKPEIPVSLVDGKWRSGIPSPFKIQVFDSSFVARNLFTGTRADRANREALSQFVLGERGVSQANQIAEMRKQRSACRVTRKRVAGMLHGVGDMDDFVKLQVSESEDELKAKLQPLFVEKDQIEQRLASLVEIQRRPFLAELSEVASRLSTVERLNSALCQSLSSSHAAARDRVDLHIREHWNGGRRPPLDWLRQGLDAASGPGCPFCEQGLDSAPAGLLESYRLYFDETFRSQVSAVTKELGECEKAIRNWQVPNHADTLQRNALVLGQYPELARQKMFSGMQARFNELGEAVNEASLHHARCLNRLREAASVAIEQKRQATYEAFEPLDAKELTQSITSLDTSVRALNECLLEMNDQISAFKIGSDQPTLRNMAERVSQEIRVQESLLRRLNSAAACEEYRKARAEDIELESGIEKAEQALVAEQSEYLQRFFESINRYFDQLGTRHFTIGIEQELNRQGYLPVLSLVVKYHGVVIEPQKLGAVFSESDRRALALSIFWAKLSALPPLERASTIVVLDDPITSFDDNRIAAAIGLARTEAASLRQLIVFTHYHSFARRWLDVESTGAAMSFHELTRTNLTSTLKVGDPKEFLESEHQKLFRKLWDFVEGRTKDSIRTDLRVYLENEVRDRYRQQLHVSNMTSAQFSEVIDFLRDSNTITPEVASKIHSYRQDLNGPHHVLAKRGDDEWATTARLMLDFIYSEL